MIFQRSRACGFRYPAFYNDNITIYFRLKSILSFILNFNMDDSITTERQWNKCLKTLHWLFSLTILSRIQIKLCVSFFLAIKKRQYQVVLTKGHEKKTRYPNPPVVYVCVTRTKPHHAERERENGIYLAPVLMKSFRVDAL